MEKTYISRNRKREDNLTTTEAILKVLTRIFWEKKEGRRYHISIICEECGVMHLNRELVEGLYDWKQLPTWGQAEALRQSMRKHANDNWSSLQKGYKPESVSPVSNVSEAIQPIQEEQEVQEEGVLFDLSGSGVIRWIDGHQYQITRID